MEQQLRENFKKCNRNLKQISVNVQKFPLLLNRKTEVLFKGHVSLDKKAVTSPLQSLLAPWVLSAADMVCVINKDHVDKKECLVNIISSLRGSTTVKANTVYSLRECRLEGHEWKNDFRTRPKSSS